MSCIYELPVRLHEQGLDDQLADRLNIWSRPPELGRWRRIVDQFTNPKGQVRIGIVGKYVHLKDSYKSLHEALIHGGMARSVRVELDYIDAEELERAGGEKAALAARLRGLDGLLVPGGFGERGSEGKINAIRYARENGVPYFGICLGMQLAVVEFARNRCGLAGAGSREFAELPAHPCEDRQASQHAQHHSRPGHDPHRPGERVTHPADQGAGRYVARRVDERQATERHNLGHRVTCATPGGSDEEAAEAPPRLSKRGGALAGAYRPDGVRQRGPDEDDQRKRGRDKAQVGKAHPEHQLVGPIRRNVEHAAEETAFAPSAGDDPVDGVEQQSDEQQAHAGESCSR